MPVRDDYVREEIMQVGGRRCASQSGRAPGQASAPAVQRHRHAAGSPAAVRGCTRPGHRGDRFDARASRLSASQSALPFHHPGPAPCARCCMISATSRRRAGYLLGRRAGSAVRAVQPAPVPAADPGGDLSRAADDGAAQPAAAGENLILRRYGDLWGGSAKTDPDALTSALRKARISPLSMGYLYQNTARWGSPRCRCCRSSPAHPGAHGRRRTRSSRWPTAASSPRPSRTRRCTSTTAGHVELVTRPSLLTPLITSPRVMTRQKGSSPGTVVAGGRPRSPSGSCSRLLRASARWRWRRAPRRNRSRDKILRM